MNPSSKLVHIAGGSLEIPARLETSVSSPSLDYPEEFEVLPGPTPMPWTEPTNVVSLLHRPIRLRKFTRLTRQSWPVAGLCYTETHNHGSVTGDERFNVSYSFGLVGAFVGYNAMKIRAKLSNSVHLR